MNLQPMQMADNQANVKTTLLHRPNGTWHNQEVSKLVNGLNTEVSGHPKHQEYLIIYGHFTKEQTLAAILGGVAYTTAQMTGVKGLPFVPAFV